MEKWQDIKDYPNRQVSDMGRIRFFKNGVYNIRKCTPNERGYVRMQLKNKGKTLVVHRLVAEAFIPNPYNLPEVNHINGIRHDNRVDNLEWVTKSENQIHARRTGLLKTKRGEKHWNATLTDSDVKDIKKLIKDGTHPKIISTKYKISLSNISNIKYGTSWKHIRID